MNDKPVGKCCKGKPTKSILYDGSPRDNFIMLVCSKHVRKSPFNQHVIKVEKLGNVKK